MKFHMWHPHSGSWDSDLFLCVCVCVCDRERVCVCEMWKAPGSTSSSDVGASLLHSSGHTFHGVSAELCQLFLCV